MLIQTKNLEIKYEKNPPVKLRITIFPKNRAKIGKHTGKRKRRQTGGFPNRYDFAYGGRVIVNQAGKIAPGIINKATSDINKIAKERID